MDQKRNQAVREAFDRGANSVEAWRRTAEGLAAAALVLRENRVQIPSFSAGPLVPVEARRLFQRLWPELMLWGMSIEDFLKCLFLKKGGSLASGGKYRGPPGHDLVKLASNAKFCLPPDQQRIVARLSLFIQWWGRYPVPTDFSGMAVLKQWIAPVHDQTVDTVLAKLRESVGDEEKTENAEAQEEAPGAEDEG